MWAEPICKGIVHQVRRDGKQVVIVGMVDPVSLEGAEVVGVTEFRVQLLENLPVLSLARESGFSFEIPPKIDRHSIVVEERIVDIEQEDDVLCLRLAHPPRWSWSRLHVTLPPPTGAALQ